MVLCSGVNSSGVCSLQIVKDMCRVMQASLWIVKNIKIAVFVFAALPSFCKRAILIYEAIFMNTT